MNINDLATSIHKKTNKQINKNNYSFDIVTILTIANIIIKLIELFMDRKDNYNEVAHELKNMSPVKKIALRWLVFKNVKNAGERKMVYEGIRDSFKDLKKDSIVELINEQKLRKGV